MVITPRPTAPKVASRRKPCDRPIESIKKAASQQAKIIEVRNRSARSTAFSCVYSCSCKNG